MLTTRERQLLQLLIDGRSPMKAAAEMGLSYNTIRTHQGHILDKLGVRSLVQAVVYAFRHGMTPTPGGEATAP
jgi:DNA-binding CsgD family transcriptional regulator